MLYAKTSDGQKVKANLELKGTQIKFYCPFCDSLNERPLRLRCGGERKPHFAHPPRAECDPWASGKETDWHIGWKELVDEKYCEVTITKNGERHRADIQNKDGLVIELQHSMINEDDIKDRELFYGDMVWLFDATYLKDNVRLHLACNLKRDVVFYEYIWKWARKWILSTQKPLFLDMGNDLIFYIPNKSLNKGFDSFSKKDYGCEISKSTFINKVLKGKGLKKLPLTRSGFTKWIEQIESDKENDQITIDIFLDPFSEFITQEYAEEQKAYDALREEQDASYRTSMQGKQAFVGIKPKNNEKIGNNRLTNRFSVKKGDIKLFADTWKIKYLDLPEQIVQFYLNSGIEKLYPPQAEAIEKGLIEGNNMLAAIPTASGKTLLAELAMLKAISEGGKALYIVPLRALATEKFDRFRTFSSVSVKNGENRGLRVGISTGDFESRDEWLGSNDIIVATSEKTDSLLRNETSWMQEITTIVVDEVHLLDSANRGPTLEVTLTKLMKLNPDCQIIALSATVGNAYEVADWLKAKLVLSEWRPTDLHEGVYYAGNINFRSSQKRIEARTKDDAVNILLDTLEEGGQCLVFESSRKNSVSFAKRAGMKVSETLDKPTRNALDELVEQIIENGETEATNELAKCVRNGTAFHHAGLNSAHRKIVEDGFRSNNIKVISSTPTLAAGLNLPARRVIIRSYRRYDPNYGMQPIPVLDYKQMAGRAGRPHLDPYGESVLIAKSYNEMTGLFDNYIYSDAEDIWSKLGSENALRTHILSTIVNGFATTRDGLMEFIEATFFAHQNDTWGIMDVVDECLDFLRENKMLEGNETLLPTALGRLVSTLYIDPLSGAYIVDGLKKAQHITDLTLLHLICKAPDMRQLYMRSNDYEIINDIVMAHSDEFAEVPPRSKEIDYEWFLAEVKTALLIQDWINETSLDKITKKFNVGEGDVHAFSDIAEWLMHSMSRLAGLLAPELINDVSSQISLLEKRIHYGASPELIELVSIRGIGRVRARKLYDNGIKTVEDIKSSGIEKVSELIGPKTARKLFEEIGIHLSFTSDSSGSVSSKTMSLLMENEQSTFSDFEK